MDAGEGTKIVAIFGALAGIGALGLIGAVNLGKKWARSVDGWPIDDADHDAFDVADAMVPELAAAKRNPCNCRGCSRRNIDPCSDFEED